MKYVTVMTTMSGSQKNNMYFIGWEVIAYIHGIVILLRSYQGESSSISVIINHTE